MHAAVMRFLKTVVLNLINELLVDALSKFNSSLLAYVLFALEFDIQFNKLIELHHL